MTENQIHPDDISAYIQDNGLPQNNIDLADMVNFFAELIVRECCDVVIDSDPSPKMILHEPYRTIMNNIQEHFGVQE